MTGLAELREVQDAASAGEQRAQLARDVLVRAVSGAVAAISVLVVPAGEEIVIARQTAGIVKRAT